MTAADYEIGPTLQSNEPIVAPSGVIKIPLEVSPSDMPLALRAYKSKDNPESIIFEFKYHQKENEDQIVNYANNSNNEFCINFSKKSGKIYCVILLSKDLDKNLSKLILGAKKHFQTIHPSIESREHTLFRLCLDIIKIVSFEIV